MRTRVRVAGLVAATLVAGLTPAIDIGASASSRPHDVASSSAVTVNKTVTRNHLVAGADDVVDTRNISLTVSQTTNLRSQRISVQWSGAHPTGAIYSDQNAAPASNEEYPFVLMECRGTSEDASLPAAQRLSPATCWTQSFSIERYVESRDGDHFFPPYRVDRYATAADRQSVVGAAPKCFDDAPVQHWVPFVAADGTTYYGGRTDCGGTPPEASDLTTADHPGNTTYGVTHTDGTGNALFTVWNEQDNASLGCSSSVPCSLVAIPIEGLSCDAAASGLPADDQPPAGAEQTKAAADCQADGQTTAGSRSASGDPSQVDQTVTGALWWSASNWRNKIVVPLTFAPSASVCDVVSSAPTLSIYGSELLSRATSQWAPALCTGTTAINLRHIQSAEPQARNLLLTGQVKGAFVEDGPDGGYSTPTVSVPTAVTGFSVSYSIDDADGNPYRSLKLNARLLAKLMTESYPVLSQIKQGASYLSSNPLTLLDDPEFKALNPGLKGLTARDPADGAIILLSSDSDVINALTSYIEADPEAADWLDGDPDPWGMVVNRNYQTHRARAQVSLPTPTWPLLDTYVPKDYYARANGDLNPCLYEDPVPYLPLVASPTERLSVITNNIELSTPSAQTNCVQQNPGQTIGQKLASPGRQQQGARFVIGITALPDAQRYLLDAAALETQSTASANAQIADATGRTFVTPTDATLQAAADLATPDPTKGVWTIPYGTLRTAAAGANAYPGTMIVSTAVPTSGLAKADAANLATFLKFATGTGQTPGLGNGQLPPGYIPVTSATGLGALHSYAVQATAAIAAQKGALPSLLGAKPTPSPSPSRTKRPSGSATPTTSAPSSSVPVASSSTPVPVLPVVTPGALPEGVVPAPSVAPATSGPVQITATGSTVGYHGGAAAALVPLAFLVLLLGGGGAAVTTVRDRRRKP